MAYLRIANDCLIMIEAPVGEMAAGKCITLSVRNPDLCVTPF